jgi:hypothetical protein
MCLYLRFFEKTNMQKKPMKLCKDVWYEIGRYLVFI